MRFDDKLELYVTALYAWLTGIVNWTVYLVSYKPTIVFGESNKIIASIA